MRTAAAVLRWLAVSPSSPKKRNKNAPTCDDCFFRCRGLCALDLDSPCSTFRPDRPEGLVPPRQPALLLRDPVAVNVDEHLAQTA